LSFKPDFARTVERFEAWWQCELIDRPPLSVQVKPISRTPARPAPADLRQRWMDVEYVVESSIDAMEHQAFVGDTFPTFWPNVGPEISSAIFGCEMEFGE